MKTCMICGEDVYRSFIVVGIGIVCHKCHEDSIDTLINDRMVYVHPDCYSINNFTSRKD